MFFFCKSGNWLQVFLESPILTSSLKCRSWNAEYFYKNPYCLKKKKRLIMVFILWKGTFLFISLSSQGSPWVCFLFVKSAVLMIHTLPGWSLCPRFSSQVFWSFIFCFKCLVCTCLLWVEMPLENKLGVVPSSLQFLLAFISLPFHYLGVSLGSEKDQWSTLLLWW